MASPCTADLLREVLDLLQAEGAFNTPAAAPVIEFKHPDSLRDEVLDLELCTYGFPYEKLISICKDVARYSVKTGHPYFLNQLYHGVDPYGLAGACFSEALNTNQYTYEVAPVFTLCEIEVIKRSLRLFGLHGGSGIFSPGGSISNMYAVVLARFKKFPDVKKKGLANHPPFVLFTSQDSHYSLLKSANWTGIGTDNVVLVETDSAGRMIPSQLEKNIVRVIEEGKCPLLVNATAGTTVLGAIDPIKKISNICHKYGIWLHVDACWGGSLIFSKTHSCLLQGTNRADSVAWNPHKMLGAPLQCSMFLLKEKGLLDKCNSAKATYLFQKDKMYDTEYDTGDMSVQCGRKVDAFKLWLMWKARGDHGFSQLVDQALSSARYLLEKIRSRPGFKLVSDEFQSSNITFWYIPPRLRDQPETDLWWKEINQVAPNLKSKLVQAGTLMISYQPLVHKNLKNFFRVAVTCHPPATFDQMDYIVSEIEKHGEYI